MLVFSDNIRSTHELIDRVHSPTEPINSDVHASHSYRIIHIYLRGVNWLFFHDFSSKFRGCPKIFRYFEYYMADLRESGHANLFIQPLT